MEHMLKMISRKWQTRKRMLSTYLQLNFVEFHSAVTEEYKMYQPIRGRGGHLIVLFGPKNTNVVKDVFPLVKFCWIPFSRVRGEVENIFANLRPGRSSCFSYRSEKHKLGRRHWYLASCTVHCYSVSGVRWEV